MSAHAGILLREARKTKGLRQWETARDAGMGAARLSTLEGGRDRIRPGDARRLAPVLGIAARDLLLAPRPARRLAPASPWRAVTARSFKGILGSCPCDWRMTFEDCKPSGWELERAHPGCRHHGDRAGR